MKRTLIAAVVAVAGCGRLGFDRVTADSAPRDTASDVTLAGHDEDGDGVDDAIDVCPMVADDQTDADGDGVGAACDPDDTKPAQYLAMFDPMLTMSTSISLPTGNWSQGTDELISNGGFAELDRMQAIADADIWIGLDIKSIAGNTQQVITHPSMASTPLRYYGQLYHTTGVNEATVLSYDDVTFTSLDSVPLSAQGVHTGALVMVTRVRTSPASLDFRAAWGAESYHVMSATPAYAGSSQVRVETDGMVVGVTFMAVIATN